MLYCLFQIRTNNPNNNVVKLVEYCYDAEQRKVLFAHYKAYQSVYLDSQHKTNVGRNLNIDIKILKGQIFPINFYNFGPSRPKTSEVFGIGKRVASPTTGFQYALAIGQSRLNQYLEWRVLRQHNWKKYLQILRAISRKFVTEVSKVICELVRFNHDQNCLLYRFMLEPQMDLAM
jgi:hypothetical protein